mmetsp:Transcript_92693/g.145514  ORF Transcript_92693/g.145514 Transcript_92693/m.145514 type:complete len:245 (+) Transcript_92693:453-1187(+)
MARRLRGLRRVVRTVEMRMKDRIAPVHAISPLPHARSQVQRPRLNHCGRHSIQVQKLPRQLSLSTSDIDHSRATSQHVHTIRVQQPSPHNTCTAVVLHVVAPSLSTVRNLRIGISILDLRTFQRGSTDIDWMTKQAILLVLASPRTRKVFASRARWQNTTSQVNGTGLMQPEQRTPSLPLTKLLDGINLVSWGYQFAAVVAIGCKSGSRKWNKICLMGLFINDVNWRSHLGIGVAAMKTVQQGT